MRVCFKTFIYFTLVKKTKSNVWSCFLKVIYLACFGSFGAHSACQFTASNVREAWQWTTLSFHEVQKGTILAIVTAMNKLCLPINAKESGWMLVARVPCHQVPMVLLGPTRGTVIPSAGIINCVAREWTSHTAHGTSWLCRLFLNGLYELTSYSVP